MLDIRLSLIIWDNSTKFNLYVQVKKCSFGFTLILANEYTKGASLKTKTL